MTNNTTTPISTAELVSQVGVAEQLEHLPEDARQQAAEDMGNLVELVTYGTNMGVKQEAGVYYFYEGLSVSPQLQAETFMHAVTAGAKQKGMTTKLHVESGRDKEDKRFVTVTTSFEQISSSHERA